MMNDRLFSDLYDSVSQRENAARLGSSSLTDFYVARYRLDSLLTATIVVRDSAVLDGRFHLSLRPDELLAKLGRTQPAPLVIRSRASTLTEALLQLWVGEGPNLQRLALSTIPEYSLRKAAEDLLAGTPKRFVTSPWDVLDILRDCLPDETIAVFEEGWGQWIAAESQGKLVVEPWGRQGLPIQAAFAVEPLQDALALLESDEAREMARELYAQFVQIQDRTVSQNRSLVDDAIEERLQAADPHVRPEMLAVRSWLYRAYNRASAARYDCNFETTEEPALPAISPLRRVLRAFLKRNLDGRSPGGSGTRDIPLPDPFLRRLALMPDDLFRWFVVKQEPRLARWWREGDAAALRHVIDALSEEIEWPSEGAGGAKDTVIKVGVKTASYILPPAGGLVGALAGGMTGAPFGAMAGRAAADLFEFFLRSRSPKESTVRRVVEYGTRRATVPLPKAR